MAEAVKLKNDKIKNKDSEEDDKLEEKTGKEVISKEGDNSKASTSKEKNLDVDNSDLTVVASGSNVVNVLNKNIPTSVVREVNQLEDGEKGPGISEKVVKEGTLLRIQDIIDAISIVVSSGEGIRPEIINEFVDVLKMQIRVPRVVNRMDSQLEFINDPLREWCLLRMNQIECGLPSELGTIELFLQNIYNIIETTTDSFYRRFHIEDRKYVGLLRIVPPECVGFPVSINNLNAPGLASYVMDNGQNFLPRADARREFEVIRVVLPRVFHDFHLRTQAYINREGRDIQEWIQDFVQRKRTDITGGIHEILSPVGVMWENSVHPRHTSVLLSRIPNYNLVSIAYASEFVFPEFYLSDVDISALSATMSINTNKAEPLTPLVVGTPNVSNEEDFRRVMLAMLFPQQVNVEVIFDHSKSKVYNGVVGLMCKLLFSTSPFFHNILPVSARNIDMVIGDMLIAFGYTRDMRMNPLAVAGRGGGDVWQNLATSDETGQGWINHGTEAAIDILNPLYDGIAVLPNYANQVSDANILELYEVQVPEPPIFLQIIACLTHARTQSTVAGKVCALFEYFRDSYQMFLINLNRHTYRYGETGFRLSDAARVDMERNFNDVRPQMNVLNSPQIVRVNADSIGKYFLRLPLEFVVSPKIYKQPVAESVVCGDIQRILVMFRVVIDWVIRERWNQRYPIRHVMSMVLSSVPKERTSRTILNFCLRKGDLKKINPRAFLNVDFLVDDFGATFFPDCADLLNRHLIYFGLTRDVVLRPATAIIPRQNIDALRPTGILFHNALQLPDVNMMSVQDIEDRCSALELLAILYEGIATVEEDRQYWTFPGYMRYSETAPVVL